MKRFCSLRLLCFDYFIPYKFYWKEELLEDKKFEFFWIKKLAVSSLGIFTGSWTVLLILFWEVKSMLPIPELLFWSFLLGKKFSKELNSG